MCFNSNMHQHIICVCHTHEKSQLKNVVQAYLSSIFAHKGGSIAILSDNRTELKKHSLRHVTKSASKEYPQNTFHPQGNSTIKNMHNFLRRTITKFLESSDLEWNKLLPFACYCYNIFPGSNGTEPPFS